jgi:hypothetical protein
MTMRINYFKYNKNNLTIVGLARWMKHRSYIEKMCLDYRSKIVQQVCETGVCDVMVRELYLKWNDRLKEVNKLINI